MTSYFKDDHQVKYFVTEHDIDKTLDVNIDPPDDSTSDFLKDLETYGEKYQKVASNVIVRTYVIKQD